MSDLIAARYDEVSASEFEDDMVVIVITDEQSEDIEVISDLDDLFVNTEVVVIDGDALEVDYDNAGYFSSENSYEVSVDDMLFDNTVGEQLMDCGFSALKANRYSLFIIASQSSCRCGYLFTEKPCFK
jgi:predicted transcriptional regulator